MRLPFLKLQQHAHSGTHKRYRVSSKPLVKCFGWLRMGEIAAAYIEQFNVRLTKQCSTAGVNRDLAALRFNPESRRLGRAHARGGGK